jgi:hypothetical protein
MKNSTSPGTTSRPQPTLTPEDEARIERKHAAVEKSMADLGHTFSVETRTRLAKLKALADAKRAARLNAQKDQTT